MDSKSWVNLPIAIENERRKLYEVSEQETWNSQKLIRQSQELDELIYKYQQAKTPCLTRCFCLPARNFLIELGFIY
ncbi:MAG: aspartyl-phosphate phosphatase Spo0E family protein [Firmicutes bacterium]|nr:aspartyl-phosphate phosphatase Spo0E family protein [Bacillota bacterium]